MSLPQKISLAIPAPLKIPVHKIYPVNAEKKWSIVSFFAGCGGFDLGFLGGFEYKDIHHEKLPFRILNAYEFNKRAIETYKKNIGDHITFQNLYDFNPENMPAADILIGGFPCQDFSLAGKKRGLNTKRGTLYKAMIKYAAFHSPKIIVGENVINLLHMQDGAVLNKIINDIHKIGYKTKIWPMHSPEYGIPQNRKRVFIVCVREDLKGFPIPPQPTHTWGYKTTEWAIQDLEEINSDDIIANQSQFSKIPLENKFSLNTRKNSAKKPSHTVCAGGGPAFHYKLNRRMTIRECARIQTFPDNFIFSHTIEQNILQIGNAVPPMLGHKIARSVADFLKEEEI